MAGAALTAAGELTGAEIERQINDAVAGLIRRGQQPREVSLPRTLYERLVADLMARFGSRLRPDTGRGLTLSAHGFKIAIEPIDS